LCIGEFIIGETLVALVLDAFETSSYYEQHQAPSVDIHIKAVDDYKAAYDNFRDVGAVVAYGITKLEGRGKGNNGAPPPDPKYNDLQISNNNLIKAASPSTPGLPPLQDICKGWRRAITCGGTIGYVADLLYETIKKGGSDNSDIQSGSEPGTQEKNTASKNSSSTVPSYNNYPSTEPSYNNYPNSSQHRQRQLDY
jgi:hypothetical protein